MPAAMKPDQKKNNLRLALILASVAAVFFFGFMAKMIFLGH
ncbi:cytochrome oxidase small assembly protein [Polaromonas hydrogenivorans]